MGKKYKVYNSQGIVIYPIENSKNKINIGDAISLVKDATYTSGGTIPKWVFNSKLYLREIRSDGTYVISTRSSGPITGVVDPKYIIKYSKDTNSNFNSYLVQIDTNILNVRAKPNNNSAINTQVSQNQIFTIIDEKDGWGKLKSGAGWISLKYTKKMG